MTTDESIIVDIIDKFGNDVISFVDMSCPVVVEKSDFVDKGCPAAVVKTDKVVERSVDEYKKVMRTNVGKLAREFEVVPSNYAKCYSDCAKMGMTCVAIEYVLKQQKNTGRCA